MTMDRYGPYQIAKALKEDKVEIPAVHMAKKDAGLWKGRVEEIKDPYGWGSSTVAGILKKRCKGNNAGENQPDVGYRSKPTGSVLKLGGCN